MPGVVSKLAYSPSWWLYGITNKDNVDYSEEEEAPLPQISTTKKRGRSLLRTLAGIVIVVMLGLGQLSYQSPTLRKFDTNLLQTDVSLIRTSFAAMGSKVSSVGETIGRMRNIVKTIVGQYMFESTKNQPDSLNKLKTRAQAIFDKADVNKDDELSVNEMIALVNKIDPLIPPTGIVRLMSSLDSAHTVPLNTSRLDGGQSMTLNMSEVRGLINTIGRPDLVEKYIAPLPEEEELDVTDSDDIEDQRAPKPLTQEEYWQREGVIEVINGPLSDEELGKLRSAVDQLEAQNEIEEVRQAVEEYKREDEPPRPVRDGYRPPTLPDPVLATQIDEDFMKEFNKNRKDWTPSERESRISTIRRLYQRHFDNYQGHESPDGQLGAEELRLFWKGLGLSANDDEVASFLADYDLNKDGRVSEAEYIDVLLSRERQDEFDKLVWGIWLNVYKPISSDNSLPRPDLAGTLVMKDQFVAYLKSRKGFSATMNPEEFVSYMSKESSSLIRFEDFRRVMQAAFGNWVQKHATF